MGSMQCCAPSREGRLEITRQPFRPAHGEIDERIEGVNFHAINGMQARLRLCLGVARKPEKSILKVCK